MSSNGSPDTVSPAKTDSNDHRPGAIASSEHSFPAGIPVPAGSVPVPAFRPFVFRCYARVIWDAEGAGPSCNSDEPRLCDDWSMGAEREPQRRVPRLVLLVVVLLAVAGGCSPKTQSGVVRDPEW